MRESNEYWRRARRIGQGIYRSRSAKTVDEQAGPAYFAGCWLSRLLFWRRLSIALGAIPETDRNCCVDFGCGFGLALPLLRERFQHTIGVDTMPDLSSEFMVRWEREQREAGESFSVLTGNAAMHIAVDYLDTIAGAVTGETIQ